MTTLARLELIKLIHRKRRLVIRLKLASCHGDIHGAETWRGKILQVEDAIERTERQLELAV